MVSPDSAIVVGARRALRTCLDPLARVRGFEVRHAERIPAVGPWLLCCNHAAFVDSVYLHLAAPVDFAVCGGHPRLFRSRGRRLLMAVGNVRQVEDESSFMRVVGERLRAGRPVLVYPEGGRNPDGLGPFRPWAARASLEHEVPIVPAYLWGTTSGQEPPVRLSIGQMLRPSGDAEALTDRLRERIESLAEELSPR